MAEEYMPEHEIVVVFDVSGPDRVTAANALATALGNGGLLASIRNMTTMTDGNVTVESWWFAERDLKTVDGNDNNPMRLVHDERED